MRMLLSVFLICLAGCSKESTPPRGTPSKEPSAPAAATSPALAAKSYAAATRPATPRLTIQDTDLTAVRAYLKNHIHEGDWEEARWWPARDMVEWKSARASGPNIPHWRNAPVVRMCKLNYWAKFGDRMELFENTYVLTDGKAIPFNIGFFTSKEKWQEDMAAKKPEEVTVLDVARWDDYNTNQTVAEKAFPE